MTLYDCNHRNHNLRVTRRKTNQIMVKKLIAKIRLRLGERETTVAGFDEKLGKTVTTKVWTQSNVKFLSLDNNMAGSLIFGRDFLMTRDLAISVCDSV